VICVTHLPQIAAFADAHFAVHKTTAGNRTVSVLEALKDESRAREIAVMLAGPQPTEPYLRNANELIEKAVEWKGSYGGVG